jgi:hypothetical protein
MNKISSERRERKINLDAYSETFVEGLTGIWVPPAETTEFASFSTTADAWDEQVMESCMLLDRPIIELGEEVARICYPIPEELRDCLEGDNDPDIGENRGFVRYLLQAGWRRVFPDQLKLKSLVREFTKMAQIPPEELEHYVRSFVLRWGPLWLCRKHRSCCWAPFSYSRKAWSECKWWWWEPLLFFQARATQASAVIRIAEFLARDEHAPMELWCKVTPWQSDLHERTIYPDGRYATLAGRSEIDLIKQRSFLTETVDRFLAISGRPTLRVYWAQNEGRMRMFFDHGLGFFRLVWIQIAQGLSEGNMSRCSACGHHYVAKRKPPRGRNHFCPECSKNKRGSKKLWARKNRESFQS